MNPLTLCYQTACIWLNCYSQVLLSRQNACNVNKRKVFLGDVQRNPAVLHPMELSQLSGFETKHIVPSLPAAVTNSQHVDTQ